LLCSVADDAPFLADIPERFAGRYEVVPRSRIHELLGVPDDRYCAVLSEPKGCANGALLCQQVLAHLQASYPDRFRYADHTHVGTIRLDNVTDVDGRHRVAAGDVHVLSRHVVLCTNAFTDHEVLDGDGGKVELAPDQTLSGLVGFMAAFVDSPREPAALSFVRQPVVGMDQTPYAYTTRRSYPGPDGTATLTCMGGPDAYLEDTAYDPDAPVPGEVLDVMDREILPFAAPQRAPGTPYDYHWHGLMGYTDNLLRIVGTHPDHAGLHYNLACNGVGFLPSIYGGHRIGRILAGDRLGPSIFDPRSPAARAVGDDPASP
jgi:glycine/D-amino acid oxidase-like deaminating enzyme